jgi:hypothetical protein
MDHLAGLDVSVLPRADAHAHVRRLELCWGRRRTAEAPLSREPVACRRGAPQWYVPTAECDARCTSAATLIFSSLANADRAIRSIIRQRARAAAVAA